MTDYSKLVEALRETAKHLDGISRFPYDDDPAKRIYSKNMADATAAIEELLPKRGEWELIDGAEPMRWGCSRCKYMSWETSNYCPRCGAKMMEAQDG